MEILSPLTLPQPSSPSDGRRNEIKDSRDILGRLYSSIRVVNRREIRSWEGVCI